jgi:uncharacterized protein (TIGR00369 family)
MGVAFESIDDGSVRARFGCEERFEGFPGVVHGGVVAALLDGAMLNCLLASGTVAVTARLSIRYRGAVCTGREAVVRARCTRSTSSLHVLEAEVSQEGRVKATAEGTFMTPPGNGGDHASHFGSA